ncbi:uncharacterized protein KZ484_019878 [Pholidichthys leucotaenia]
MACPRQSAAEYVSNARAHLVRALNNLPVIVENLYQQRVLTGEEVSKIKTERDDYDKTRKLVDSLINKGNKACYEFLKILNVMRNWTSGRSSHLQRRNETSEFDQYDWASCFILEEDTQMDVQYLQGPKPCYTYQKKLKSQAQDKSNEFWKKSQHLFQGNMKPDLSYTPLVLEHAQESDSRSKIKKLKRKKSKMPRRKKLKTYIPEEKSDLSPSDLLKTDKNILLVGKPGIGKTALVHELLRLWAERASSELDYMFYFDMRDTSQIMAVKSWEDLCGFCERDEDIKEVIQMYSDNVTFIFDGASDLSSLPVVEKLIKNQILPFAKIIITCRPEDEDEELFPGDFDRVEVKGFSEHSIKTYLSATLGEERKILDNLELFSLCYVPMYALMVAVCSFSQESLQPYTVTETYINVVRYCLQINSGTKKKDLNTLIIKKSKDILSLAEVSYKATQKKTVNLDKLKCEDRCVLSFLKLLFIEVAPTEVTAECTFLHYTIQEFFAAVWLLKNPDKIREVFQQCLTVENKHLKHLIPFMCRLLNEKSPSLMEHLIPVADLKNISRWFFKQLIDIFLCQKDVSDDEDSGPSLELLFLCQCLYESQCPEACIYLLNKLNYNLDLSGEDLDLFPTCAVAYVVKQSKERKIFLNLEDADISEHGMRQLFECLINVQWCDPLPRQLWKIYLLSKGEIGFSILLELGENQMHLPVEGKRQLFERAVKVLQKMTTNVGVCLYWDRQESACRTLCRSLLEALPSISSLSFKGADVLSQEENHSILERERKRLLLDLSVEALHRGSNLPNVMKTLFTLFTVKTGSNNFLLDLYQYIKSEGFSSSELKPLFQSSLATWSINLSKVESSVLLEVLKLQPEKKKLELTGWSDESEVRSLLQCLPYISQLSFLPQMSEPSDEIRFFVNLICAAAKREQQTREERLDQLTSICTYKTLPLNEKWCDFLLDWFHHEAEAGISVSPSLQSFLQSSPSVWSIDLSERKTSVLLEVLKLQPEKKYVELIGWSDEESEVRSMLPCLPYISQLSLLQLSPPLGETRFFVNLFCAAAEKEQQTREKILEQLSSVCIYRSFTIKQKWCDFLLDLYSYKQVLPSLRSVFQSTPSVWYIDLSERKTAILLDMLRIQSEKKRINLTGWSHEANEGRDFLQCLPYISLLRIDCSWRRDAAVRLFVDLISAAAEREEQTGEKILELLSSVCRYETFPYGDRDWCDHYPHQSDFLLDLFSHVKDYQSKTGLSLLPSLQSVFQSAPSVWSIKLSERKSSILLEVLKLHPEKKPVELKVCCPEESEVRSFLQFLPYISQLRIDRSWSRDAAVRLFVDLISAAAEREEQTGEKILELLSSVCRYETFPYGGRNWVDYQSDFLLDLFSHVKDYQTKTGLSLLPSLQSVFQSVPSVWSIKLSERKSSILLEVLKLHPEKKPVELKVCCPEESEVRSFLQFLPYISQLRIDPSWSRDAAVRLFVDLMSAAAEREEQTGEKILELLSSVCRYETFPCGGRYWGDDQSDFLLDLFSHVKDYQTKTGLSLLPSLQSVFQSAPSVWSIKLSERKSSILLEVLKLHPEKKPVELKVCSIQFNSIQFNSTEESEVRSFLQCLPYISQLRIDPSWRRDAAVRLFVDLISAAAEREEQTGEKILELLSSICRYETFPRGDRYWGDDQSDFLLDLFSHVKDYQTKTGLSLLPSLQSVFQSAPSVWSIKLSERKSFILLEVLKLHPEKKPVELKVCSSEKSEVRSFLQFLPYISQLRIDPSWRRDAAVRLFVDLISAAAEREEQTGEKILELLSSVCRYEIFPRGDRYWGDDQSDFLLDLFSHVKDYQTKTGLSLLPSLQSVFQSAPSVWFINLSERKSSILLEVLKLHPEKKPVELKVCSPEESEVRSFLQFLPYISQLRIDPLWSRDAAVRLFVDLISAAAEREEQTGEKILELLSSVCRYERFPCGDRYWDADYQSDFLLDLFSHVKDYQTKTGLSLLPSLQSVFQSAPSVWSIKLSERKSSILLEVLKLHPEKKPVELKVCSPEESEVRSFLQCLPYISQLSCAPEFFQSVSSSIFVRSREEVQQLESLLQLLGFQLLLTGELSRRTCSSVGRVLRLCGSKVDLTLRPSRMSVRGAVLLFRHTAQLHSLRLSSSISLLLVQWVRRGQTDLSTAVEELSVVTEKARPPERTEWRERPPLLVLLHEIQDQVLVWSFFQ